jgi:L-seryl-tRNA(Ser) seleniumtransferase
MPNPFRNLPSVSQLLEAEPLKRLVENVNHQVVADGVRNFLDNVRTQMNSAAEDINVPNPSEMAQKIADWLTSERKPNLRNVINGTGIILHTGLGRAPLAKSAIDAVRELADGYCSVEIDLESGDRGQRIKAVERLLCELTGCEAATIVNNNAAATMLALSALAKGKEVIVSRGQLIEIGGSYRLPNVMECSGAKLREVGTTNKTRIGDYAEAINEDTGAMMLVHPSNYAVVGFSETPGIKDLVKLGSEKGLPVIDDVGSGALLDFGRFGMNDEPMVADSIAAGSDLILFSGDKLVGGPQCGIIIGKKKYVDMCLENSLMRAMRVGKMTLAALAATLEIYLKPETAEQEIPILRMLSTPIENLELRGEKLCGQLGHLSFVESIESVPSEAMLGGGSLPAQTTESRALEITPKGMTADELASQLRDTKPAVMGRIYKDRLYLDLRTVQPQDEIDLVAAFESVGK